MEEKNSIQWETRRLGFKETNAPQSKRILLLP